MKTKIFLMATLVLAMVTGNADAQSKQHSQNQKHRIKQGVKSGELTTSETKNLIGDRKEIRQDVKLAQADGNITGSERRIIKREKNQQSREIYRKKHNNRDRA